MPSERGQRPAAGPAQLPQAPQLLHFPGSGPAMTKRKIETNPAGTIPKLLLPSQLQQIALDANDLT